MLNANQAGDGNYNPAPEVERGFGVQPGADLQISKSNGVNGVVNGQSVVYTIEVGNAGPSEVVGALLTDILPDELINAVWSCTPVQLASCLNASGVGDISELLDLPVDGLLRFDLSAEVSAGSGSVSNTASIDVPADTIERVPADNMATDSDPVVPGTIFSDGFENAQGAVKILRR